VNLVPTFHKKYKSIIQYHSRSDIEFYSAVDWVNNNTSGSVDIKRQISGNRAVLYIGFENSDDATFFKIKYGN